MAWMPSTRSARLARIQPARAPGRLDQARQVTVSGPPATLLAWLIGRDNGAGLEVTGAAAVPVLPPWR
jgi:hypothetical protein